MLHDNTNISSSIRGAQQMGAPLTLYEEDTMNGNFMNLMDAPANKNTVTLKVATPTGKAAALNQSMQAAPAAEDNAMLALCDATSANELSRQVNILSGICHSEKAYQTATYGERTKENLGSNAPAENQAAPAKAATQQRMTSPMERQPTAASLGAVRRPSETSSKPTTEAAKKPPASNSSCVVIQIDTTVPKKPASEAKNGHISEDGASHRSNEIEIVEWT